MPGGTGKLGSWGTGEKPKSVKRQPIQISQSSQPSSLPAFHTSALLPLVEATNLITLNIGTLPSSKVLTITFEAVITNPLPTNVTQVCNQATITGVGINTVTDDPDTPAPGDETCTPTPQG